MAFPDLTYRARLEPELRNELELYAALLIKWLAREHDPDGRHTTITLTGITFRNADGTTAGTIQIVNGDLVITLTGGTAADPAMIVTTARAQIANILIGAAGIAGNEPAASAIELMTEGLPGGPSTLYDRWALVTGRDSLGQYVALGDHRAQAYGFKLYYFTAIAPDRYILAPPVDANPLAYHLGSKLAPPLLWHEINGRAVYARDGFTELSRTLPMGFWADVVYNAGNFTASGGQTWTVSAANVATLAYTLVGKTLWYSFTITGSSVSGPAAVLYVALPPGLSLAPTRTVYAIGFADAPGGRTPVMASASGPFVPNAIGLERGDAAPWAASAGSTYIFGQIACNIV